MKSIMELPLTTTGEATRVPVGAQILSFSERSAKPYTVVLADPDAAKEHRTFRAFTCGCPVHRAHLLDYVGTLTSQGGSLVVYIFEQVGDEDSALPEYPQDEPLALRIERCIRHEMTHGGDTFAQAKAIVRDARLGYLVFPGVIRNPS